MLPPPPHHPATELLGNGVVYEACCWTLRSKWCRNHERGAVDSFPIFCILWLEKCMSQEPEVGQACMCLCPTSWQLQNLLSLQHMSRYPALMLSVLQLCYLRVGRVVLLGTFVFVKRCHHLNWHGFIHCMFRNAPGNDGGEERESLILLTKDLNLKKLSRIRRKTLFECLSLCLSVSICKCVLCMHMCIHTCIIHRHTCILLF